MKYIFTFLMALCATVSFGQTTLIDFESATTWIDFDGGAVTTVTNPYSNSDNNSANVGKMVKSAGQTWGGSLTELGSAIDFTNNNALSMKVYSPRANTKVLLKVENSSDPAINFEKEVTMSKANAWETLTFDYSTIDTAKSYHKIVLIFDNGTAGDGTANYTFHIDDIILFQNSNALDQIDLPVNFEGSTTDYSVSDFGGNTSSLVADPTNASNKVIKSTKGATAQTWAGTTIGGASGFATAIPFTTTAQKMSVKVYSPTAGVPIRLKVEDSSDPTKSVETEATISAANTWETLEFDFSNQATGTAAINLAYSYNKASIFFDFGTAGGGTAKDYYFDDVAFGAVLGIPNFDSSFSVYPNPMGSLLTVEGVSEVQHASIFDLTGREVLSTMPNKAVFTLDTADLQHGVYMLSLQIGDTTTTHKLVK
jgi:hypothetical protein